MFAFLSEAEPRIRQYSLRSTLRRPPAPDGAAAVTVSVFRFPANMFQGSAARHLPTNLFPSERSAAKARNGENLGVDTYAVFCILRCGRLVLLCCNLRA
jgi:hypothetical protein